MMLSFLSFPNWRAFVRAISSALWAEVPGDSASAHTIWVAVVTAAPAHLSPSQTKLLPSIYQVTSASTRGRSCKSSRVPCTWASMSLQSWIVLSHSVMSDSLWHYGLRHTRPPCPSPTPRACPNSCPLSQWCHPIISSSAVPISPHLQSFLASGSFQMSQFFTSGGQSIGVFSFTISHSNEYSGPISFRMDWFNLLAVQRTLKSLL